MVISQALTKPQDITPSNPARDPRTFGANCESSSSYNINWTTSWQANKFGIPQHPNSDAYHLQRPFETPVSPHAYVGLAAEFLAIRSLTVYFVPTKC